MGIEKKADVERHSSTWRKGERDEEKERKGERHWSVAQQRPVTASTSAQIGPSQGLQNDSTP